MVVTHNAHSLGALAHIINSYATFWERALSESGSFLYRRWLRPINTEGFSLSSSMPQILSSSHCGQGGMAASGDQVGKGSLPPPLPSKPSQAKPDRTYLGDPSCLWAVSRRWTERQPSSALLPRGRLDRICHLEPTCFRPHHKGPHPDGENG